MISGVLSAVPTMFNEDFSLDIGNFEKHLNKQCLSDIFGIALLGTTGESPTIEKDERELLIKLSKSIAVKNNKHLMVGTGSNSLKTTIDLSLMAQDLGADSLLIVSPYYNKPMQKGIINYFKDIASEVSIPIIIYNIPGRTSVSMSLETIKEISYIDNICGIKEASGDISFIEDVINEVKVNRKDFSVLSGDDNLLFASTCLGGDGVISVTSNIFPDDMFNIIKYIKENKLFEARKIQYKLRNIFKLLFKETNPIPLKGALEILNVCKKTCRAPLNYVSDILYNDLKKELLLHG